MAADQDLATIASLDALKYLWLLDAPINDLHFLRGCRLLHYLYLKGEAAPDLTLLSVLPRLTGLALDGVDEPAGGLAEIAKSLPRLEELILFQCQWAHELAAISQMSRLRRLDIRYQPIGDLRPLIALQTLEVIFLGNCGFSDEVRPPVDVAPLAQLTNLRELAILESTPGLDLTPLQGRNLTVHLFPGMLDEKMASIDRIKFKIWH